MEKKCDYRKYKMINNKYYSFTIYVFYLGKRNSKVPPILLLYKNRAFGH